MLRYLSFEKGIYNREHKVLQLKTHQLPLYQPIGDKMSYYNVETVSLFEKLGKENISMTYGLGHINVIFDMHLPPWTYRFGPSLRY